MNEDDAIERRGGLSTYSLSVGGIVAILGIILSGVAAYNAIQIDISNLKRGESYQTRTDERQDEQMKANRLEYNQGLREINSKLDALIERMPMVKR